jgi:hypothetical protein
VRELCDRGGAHQGMTSGFTTTTHALSPSVDAIAGSRRPTTLRAVPPTASASGLTRPHNFYACQPLAGGPVSNSGRQRLEAERVNDSRASIDCNSKTFIYISN